MGPANPALMAGWNTKHDIVLDDPTNFDTGSVFLDRLLVLAAKGFSTSVSPVSFWSSFGLSSVVVGIFIILFVFLSPKLLGFIVRVICCPCNCCPRLVFCPGLSFLSNGARLFQRWAQLFEKNFQRLIAPLEQRRQLRNTRLGITEEDDQKEAEIELQEERERLGRKPCIPSERWLSCVPKGWYTNEPLHGLGLDARVLLRFAKMTRHIVWTHLVCIMVPLMWLHYEQNKNSTHIVSYDASGKPIAQKLAWLGKLTPPRVMSRKWLWVYPALAFLMSVIVCVFVFLSYRKVEVAREIYFDKVALYDNEAHDHVEVMRGYKTRRAGLKEHLRTPRDLGDTRKIIAARATKYILITGFTRSDVNKKKDALQGCWASRRCRYEQELIKDGVLEMPDLADLPDLIKTQNEDMAVFENLLDKVLAKHEKRPDFDDLNGTVTLSNEERTAWFCCSRGKYRPRIIKATLRLADPDPDAGTEGTDDTSSFDRVRTRSWHTLGLYLPSLIQMRIMIGQRLHNFVNNRPLVITKDGQVPSHTRDSFGTLMQVLTGNCRRGSSIFRSCRSRAHVASSGEATLHYAFRRFESRADANQAVRDLTEPSSIFEIFDCMMRRKTKIILAPAPQNIIWRNLSMEPWERTMAIAGNWLLMIGFTILFVIPNAFSSMFLSDLTNLAIFNENWKPALEAHPKILDAIEGVLAPTVQNLFYMYLPGVFRFFRGAAGEPTRSGRERDVFSKLFIFFVFNNLIVFSCFTAFVTLAYRFFASMHSGHFLETTFAISLLIPDALAAGFSHTSTYWLTYMLQRNISAALDLIPVNRMTRFVVVHVPFLAKCYSPTALKNLRNPPTTDYAGTYNNHVFTAIVMFSLMPFQPLVAAPAGIFFVLNYVDLKYNITRVRCTKYESYGSFWSVAVNWLLVATAIGAFCFGLVVLTLTRASGRAPLESLEIWLFLPSFLTLLAFRVYCSIRFETRYYGLKTDKPKFSSVSQRIRWYFGRLIWWYTPQEPKPSDFSKQGSSMTKEKWETNEYGKAMAFVVPELFRKKRSLEIRPKRQKDLDAIIRDWQFADVKAGDSDKNTRLQGAMSQLLTALRPGLSEKSKTEKKNENVVSQDDDITLGEAEAEEAQEDYINEIMDGIEVNEEQRQRLLAKFEADCNQHIYSMQYVLRQELNIAKSFRTDNMFKRLRAERVAWLTRKPPKVARSDDVEDHPPPPYNSDPRFQQ